MRRIVLPIFFLFINATHAEVVCEDKTIYDPVSLTVRKQRVCVKCEDRMVLDYTTQTQRKQRVCEQVKG